MNREAKAAYILPKADKILYGGDYNPEQWPEEIWEEDMQLFREAGIDTVTLNVFSWARIQPSEDTYDFSQLDRIMEVVSGNGLKVILATSTAAHPAWMARRHPDTMKVGPDGMRYRFGGRQQMCPSSSTFRMYAARLAGKLAERYGKYENLVGWHVSNEYCRYCYCDTCTARYRDWLRAKYGSIGALNRAWNTSFWGHTYYDFDEVVTPDLRSEEFHFGGADGPVRSNFQANSLDYRRFMSDTFLECFLLEKAEIAQYTPDVPVTTNFMGDFSELDYRKWAPAMDFISWDNYPRYGQEDYCASFWHDLMRGIGGGRPFSLIEQTPSVSNWHPYCSLKRPGVMRLWSYEAVAHGADTVMFFQMRQSAGACEKLHGALIGHDGTDRTRVFREMAQLGSELKLLGSSVLGTRLPAKAAIVFDWENWWGVSLSAGPSVDLDYLEEAHTWYRFFYDHQIPVDFVGPEDDFTGYRLLIAPMLYLAKDAFAEQVRAFTAGGGTFVSSYFSDYADENDHFRVGGIPARLQDVLGLWVEESDALPPDQENSFRYGGAEHPCRILCDVIRPQEAKALACYERDFYSGAAAVTRNAFGKGAAYYVGTRSDDAFYDAFLADLCRECGIERLMTASAGVEVTRRVGEEESYYFILNHRDGAETVTLPQDGTDLISGRTYAAGEAAQLAPKDVIILRAG